MRFSLHCIRNFGVFSRRAYTLGALDFTKVRTRTRRTSIPSLQELTRRSYTTEPSQNPSKFAQALQQENLESSRSASSSTPSAAAALGLATETNSEMAPPRRGAKAGAKPPNVDRNGKPVTTEPKPSASYVTSLTTITLYSIYNLHIFTS